MKTFWIDFSGYCKVEAENEEEAREVFWKNLPQNNEKVTSIVFGEIDVEPSE